MDILSHGLWGGLAFGRKSKLAFFLSLFLGVMPDLFSFGLFFIMSFLGIVTKPDWGQGLPDPQTIPPVIHSLYNITHSLIVFAFVFIVIWFWNRKPFYPLVAWGLHILMDIPTHSINFFPTPFLWPQSDFVVNGINWSHPAIFYSNVFLLVLGYSFFLLWRRR